MNKFEDIPQAIISDVQRFSIAYDKPMVYHLKDWSFQNHFFTNFKSSANSLTVMLHGAIDRTKKPFPNYQRWSWSADIHNSVLVLNDPTLLDNKLRIGWWQGDKDTYPLPDACKFIRLVLDELGFTSQQLMFYGSSAGGFASLMMAGHFRGSTALVNNPQTNCLAYRQRKVTRLLKQKFAGAPKDVLFDEDPTRFSVAHFYESINYIPAITYYQCIEDSHHYENHFQPFVQTIYKFKPLNFEPILYHQPHGNNNPHAPLDRATVVPIMNKAIHRMESYLQENCDAGALFRPTIASA